MTANLEDRLFGDGDEALKDEVMRLAKEGGVDFDQQVYRLLVEALGARTLKKKGLTTKADEGVAPIYFGEKETEIIEGLAVESGRAYDEQVRELVLESLIAKGLVTDQVKGVELTFFGKEVPKLKPMRLWGEIAAGKPIDVFEEFETVLVPEEFFTHGRENFALRVRGDSMEDEGIFEGDIIICYESPVANNGDTVVALIDKDQATVKKFYREKGKIRLQPRSTRHDPIILSPDRVTIQGIVTGIYRRTI